MYLNGEETAVLESQQGVHQEDPLGPALFSIGMQPILINLQNSHLDISVLAYLNDMFLLGPAGKVLSGFAVMTSSLSCANLLVEEKKCEIYCQSDSSYQSIPDSNTIQVTRQGTKILGTPVGCSSYVINHAHNMPIQEDHYATSYLFWRTARVLCYFSDTVTFPELTV